jgi:hypothetical protein
MIIYLEDMLSYSWQKFLWNCGSIFNFLALSSLLLEKFHAIGYVYESLIWNPGPAPISISSSGGGPISRYQACKLMCGDSVGTLR